jgi:ABC-2 type transport system ATP-binding protein
MSVPALNLDSLSHAFGERKVLKEVSFSVDPGQFTVLLGLNGAGKTTLFALITRLYNNRSGSIAVFGQELRQHPTTALGRMGVVFQQPTLDLDLTVEQNLYYHASLHGIARSDAKARIKAGLERIDLAARAHDKVRQLSGGQRRRIEIVRSLLHKPSLLLLDEPTVGLDVASRQFILDEVRRLCREEGLAVLWATHLFDEVDAESRLVLLHHGVVLARGSGADICAQAGKPTVREAFDELTKAVAKPAATGAAA